MDNLETGSIFKTEHPFGEMPDYQRYLAVEVALARVQAELGLIPDVSAEAIAKHVKIENFDTERLQLDFQTVGFPIVGVVRQIAELVPDGHGEYAHWGATTQDIMDTGLVIALRDVTSLIDAQLDEGIEALVQLATAHDDTLMSGRSQLQQAVPITFGYKVAGWAKALARYKLRLRDLAPRVLQVQFGGAVGTMVAVHPNGPAIRAGLAAHLGLADPGFAWHSHRDTLVEFTNFLGLLTGTLAKIATDIIYMAQTEVGEISEPSVKGRGISSTMPHKRNPLLSQQILVIARQVRGISSMMMDAMIQDHERGTGSWQSEWTLVPDACTQSLAALADMIELARGLDVDKVRMKTNIGLSRGFVYAEAVMMALAPKIGRQRAHDLVEQAVDRAKDDVSFETALMEDPAINEVLSRSQLGEIFSGDLHRAAGVAAVHEALGSIKF
ncbi:3-carboxy-cis,cis-muconate cycloisomerase [Octadecabacter temperatus]|uniref:3-carboxy-cis,cis-muconate cycloisomerase n=1 Tax=Octadecabacter temperatus TaxID=1458307 RepID=A0A0K0Y737_9RHOB|nr:adenylosuccinate lyase family protein [Octadecabacter temperatus]AKS46706.1 3-carboxy-cis,cis-muconate cycloisomerase [Octadecabacter temperatus]SIO19665.1 3-carboxy-cis,cis-muconate cycloisomerase [Octadecabacter temperatus]